MSVEFFEIVREALPELTASEIDKVLALGVFLKKTKTGGVKEETVEEIFFESMKQVLEENYVSVPSYAYFKRSPTYSNFRENASFVINFFNEAFLPRRLTKVKRRHVYSFSFRLQINSMKEAGFTITLRSFVTLLKQIPAKIVVSFPGYVENQLLFKIIDRTNLNEKSQYSKII